MKTDPVVSIVVITYNSSAYIEETLESCKKQTYPSIELIVSDDASKDNTEELCCRWLEKNKESFVRTLYISSPKNGGIPANCNRGFRAAEGEWIKLIAGDDLLLPDCIENYLRYIREKTDIPAEFIISRLIPFCDVNGEKVQTPMPERWQHPFFCGRYEAGEQLKFLVRDYLIPGPTLFISKRLYEKLEGFDERYPYIEDTPLAIKACRNGYRIHFMEKDTVLYRQHQQGISRAVSGKIFGPSYIHRRTFTREIRYPLLSPLERLGETYQYYCCCLIQKLGLNRYNLFCRSIYWGIRKANIFRILSRLTKY